MKRLLIAGITSALLLTSCVSKKEYAALEARQQETQDLLNSATVKLNSCLEEKASATTRVKSLEERIAEMRKDKNELIQSSKDLTMLTKQGASNLEKSLESLKEKTLRLTVFKMPLLKRIV